MPTSTTRPPARATPSPTAGPSSSPEGRLSRPRATTTGRPSLARAYVAYAAPTARARAGVSWSPVVPRMSYWRKIVAGTFTASPLRSVSRYGSGQGGGRVNRGTTVAGEVEELAGLDAEVKHRRDADRQRHEPEPTELEPGMRVGERHRAHVHRHHHGQVVPRRNQAREHEDGGEPAFPRGDGREQDIPLPDEPGGAREPEQRQHADREREGEPRPVDREPAEVVDLQVAL